MGLVDEKSVERAELIQKIREVYDELWQLKVFPQRERLAQLSDDVILSRWELSDEDMKNILETKSVWLFMHTFGQPVMPISLQVEKPEFVNLDWDKCYQHFEYVRKVYQDLAGTPGVNTSFALEMVFRPLAERYESGERSKELYNEMMEVE